MRPGHSIGEPTENPPNCAVAARMPKPLDSWHNSVYNHPEFV
jgi:hypothetical protein